MKQVFPEIAEDPDYGINPDHPKLIGLSNEQWNAFYEDYTKGIEGGLSQTFDALKCEHVPISDSTTWDAVLAEAIITPRNARPTDYAIIFVIRANDRDVAQLVTNETLILDQTITIRKWILIKRTETSSLGVPQIYFNRLTNN